MVATDPEANAAARPASPGLFAQLVRFGLIGVFCALVDSGIYWVELQLGVWVHLAKAVSFICGTTTAYFLNRRYTFSGAHTGGAGQIGGFAALYTTTFFVNVGTNALALNLLPQFQWKVALSWIIAQATATAINFVMLKWVVFREKPDTSAQWA